MNFKSFFVLFLLLAATAIGAKAQTLKGFFDNPEAKFTWLGIDFTKAKLIGDAGANLDDIVPRQYAGINQVVVNEPKKYDISGAFHHKNYTTDLSIVNKRNETASKDSLQSDNSADAEHFTADQISRMVRSYDFAGKTGIGVMFFMESMNKTGKQAAMYVTIIDLDKKNVLMTERMTAKTGMAFGFRNFWALTVSKVLNDLDSDYKKLKAKYADAVDPEEPKPTAPAKKEAKTGVAAKEPKKQQPKKKG